MAPRRSPGAQAIHIAASPIAEQIVYGIRVGDTLRLALTTQDVADLTGKTLREVWGALERGELEATGHSRIKVITAQALLKYLGLLPDTEQRKTA